MFWNAMTARQCPVTRLFIACSLFYRLTSSYFISLFYTSTPASWLARRTYRAESADKGSARTIDNSYQVEFRIAIITPGTATRHLRGTIRPYFSSLIHDQVVSQIVISRYLLDVVRRRPTRLGGPADIF
ncbi:hypothetical protein BO71DRAFT_405294 [Aspergillus ellipticus CBS 707.79]|uniref:Uncharacterized protein n=1 Tax=Aspergillus ellipticus CBS 707.79 TaxID=1448320 RepID=A0A319DPY5_9EURO|nr:hypothetical protein BO71DRAFT_405294 [Aspergillus ellipticus CBS 707.79]